VQVIVDHQPYTGPVPGSVTVQELADSICTPGDNHDRRLVIGLACNGEAIAPEQLDRVLASAVSGFEIVELQTVSVREQVRETLAQAADTLAQAHPVAQRAADLLDEGRHEAALAELQNVLEILKQVQQTAVLTAQLLGADLETLQPAGRGFMDTLGLVKDQLHELKTGMENHDFVRVSDLLAVRVRRAAGSLVPHPGRPGRAGGRLSPAGPAQPPSLGPCAFSPDAYRLTGHLPHPPRAAAWGAYGSPVGALPLCTRGKAVLIRADLGLSHGPILFVAVNPVQFPRIFIELCASNSMIGGNLAGGSRTGSAPFLPASPFASERLPGD